MSTTHQMLVQGNLKYMFVSIQGSRLFGAVGAYDWSGGVILSHPMNNRVKFLNTTSTGKQFSYLGKRLESQTVCSCVNPYEFHSETHLLLFL